MSDDVLSVIPIDPYWQPDRTAGEAATAIVRALAPDPDGATVEVRTSWHEIVTLVDCGQNLERIGCPACGTDADTEWWQDLMEARYEDGFDDLSARMPCCGTDTSLDQLDYQWPCGFARFEIEVWNPPQIWFTDDELSRIASTLGHKVRQIRAHI